MTREQAEFLEPGDRVTYEGLEGTVCDIVLHDGFFVEWDTGEMDYFLLYGRVVPSIILMSKHG